MSNHDVRINVVPEVELHDRKHELVTSPPQEQAAHKKYHKMLINEKARDTAAAGNGSTEEKVKNGKSTPPQDLANNQSEAFKNLYKAALKDEWNTAYKKVFKEDPLKNSKYLTATISENQDTALHIAVAAESFTFAKKLVNFMQKDDLAITNRDGNTSFFLAAASGMVGLAKVMFEKNGELPGIRGGGNEEMLPIHVAAQHGHERMVDYLLGVTKDMTEEDRKKLQELTQRKDLFVLKYGLSEEKAATETICPQDTTGLSTENAETESEISHPQDKTDDQKMHEKLYRAAMRNEWYIADWEIFGRDEEKNSKYATAIISEKEEAIALHIAARAGASMFISVLLKHMKNEELDITDGDGNTAFYLAAKFGRVKCATVMYEKNKKLPSIRGDVNVLPIQVAAQHGHKEVVKFLYRETKSELRRKDCKELLPYLISRADLFDVAWDLLKKDESLITDNISNGRKGEETFLHVLARTPLMSRNLSDQNQEGLFNRFFNKFSDINKLPHEKLPKEALELLKLLLGKADCREDWMHGVIHDAVKHDNIEFLSLIISNYSEFMMCKGKGDTNTSGLIFSNAILKRQKDIFKQLEDLRPAFKRQILDYKDDEKNNILHLAGKLSPPEQLDAICGVALQLQQELMWFEEVSNIVGPSKAYDKNRKEETPKALFDEEHKQLKERSEQWMKDTANSCMIVATLIATVVFAAAFTVPGGTNDESGAPRFANDLSFRIFVLADVISLVLSVYSLLIFLAIHTSRYAEKDFLLELPKKLVFGLSTLLLSIAALMVVFCTTIFVVFKVEQTWVRILLSVSATLPVIHFFKMKRGLLFDVVRSTYKISSILADKRKRKEA